MSDFVPQGFADHLANRQSVSLPELADENLVTVGQASLLQNLTLEACRQALLRAHAELVSSRTPDDVVMELLLVRMLGNSS